MEKAPTPKNELDRLDSVKDYRLLDTQETSEFDSLTQLGAKITNSPICLITLIDEERNWFKAHLGTELTEDPRDRSFCGHAINQPESPLIVDDATKDKRFFDNPLVKGETQIHFYAGFPIVNKEGYALGTICVMDHKPKSLSEEQSQMMKALAIQALFLMEHWKKEKQLVELNTELIEVNKNLNQFSRILSEDFNSPISKLKKNAAELLQHYNEKDEDINEKKLIEIVKSSEKIEYLIDSFLEHNKTRDLLSASKKNIEIKALIKEVIQIVDPHNLHKVTYNKDFQLLRGREAALKRILINLLKNSVRHHDQARANIDIKIKSTGRFCQFIITDDGPGVHPMFQKSIFEIYNRGEKMNPQGVGIGLATVKKLVEGMGGEISLENVNGRGLKVEFQIPI